MDGTLRWFSRVAIEIGWICLTFCATPHVALRGAASAEQATSADQDKLQSTEDRRQSSATTSALEKFLQTYLSDSVLGQDKTARYSSALVDLDGDGMKETLVYVSGEYWCGSGGCTLLVLKSKNASYDVVGRTSITRLPIRVLATKTNGWNDIGVWVQGGGIQPGYGALLPFDGSSYPRGPTTPPSRPVAAGTRGKLIIPSTSRGVLLYR